MKANEKVLLLINMINEYAPVDIRTKTRRREVVMFRMLCSSILFNPKNRSSDLTVDISRSLLSKMLGNKTHASVLNYIKKSDEDLKYYHLERLHEKIRAEYLIKLRKLSLDPEHLIDTDGSCMEDLICIRDRYESMLKDINIAIVRLEKTGRVNSELKEMTKVKIEKTNKLKKAVIQMDVIGNEVEEFESVSATARKLRLCKNLVAKCCRGEKGIYNGHRFKFKHIDKKSNEILYRNYKNKEV